MKDKFDVEIKETDWLIWSWRQGSSAGMTMRKVAKIVDDDVWVFPETDSYGELYSWQKSSPSRLQLPGNTIVASKNQILAYLDQINRAKLKRDERIALQQSKEAV